MTRPVADVGLGEGTCTTHWLGTPSGGLDLLPVRDFWFSGRLQGRSGGYRGDSSTGVASNGISPFHEGLCTRVGENIPSGVMKDCEL